MKQTHHFVIQNRTTDTFRRIYVDDKEPYLKIVYQEINNLKETYPGLDIKVEVTMMDLTFHHNNPVLCRKLADQLKIRFAELSSKDNYVTISL